MPRPIHVPQGEPGITSYTLGPQEEWTLLKVTFSINPISGAGGDNFSWIDYRDPAGGIIYLQPLAFGDASNQFFSLAYGVEPFETNQGNSPYWPQSTDDYDYSYITQRLSVETLYAGCAVNVYKTAGYIAPPTDPITQVSTFYSIPDLHLWVEDVGASDYQPPAPLPPILVHAPEAA